LMASEFTLASLYDVPVIRPLEFDSVMVRLP
jgi:hypothetical protein